MHPNTEGFNVHYWRDGKHEVDFVLERRGKVIGIEVKSCNSTPHTGMPEFQKQIRPDRILVAGKEGTVSLIHPQRLYRIRARSLYDLEADRKQGHNDQYGC